jgi:hypothetical protein
MRGLLEQIATGASVQIIVRAQHCCAPTCVLDLPEKRCICSGMAQAYQKLR